MRQRINITVSPAFYDELQRIKEDYGFINICEICTTLLKLFVNKVNQAEQSNRPAPESIEDTIEQMFCEFTNWEPTPNDDVIFKRVFAHSIDGKYFDEVMTRRHNKTAQNYSVSESGSDSTVCYIDPHSYYEDTDFEE